MESSRSHCLNRKKQHWNKQRFDLENGKRRRRRYNYLPVMVFTMGRHVPTDGDRHKLLACDSTSTPVRVVTQLYVGCALIITCFFTIALGDSVVT